MKRDDKLIWEANNLDLGETRREEADKLVERYKTACFLSTGPIKARSKVWEEHAKTRGKELSIFVNRVKKK